MRRPHPTKNKKIITSVILIMINRRIRQGSGLLNVIQLVPAHYQGVTLRVFETFDL